MIKAINLTTEHLADPIGTYLWDPRFEGLDGYIWEYQFQMQNKKLTLAVG